MFRFLQEIQASLLPKNASSLAEMIESRLEKQKIIYTELHSDKEISSTLLHIDSDMFLCSQILSVLINDFKKSRPFPEENFGLLTEFRSALSSALRFTDYYASKTIGYGTFHAPTLRYPFAKTLYNFALTLQEKLNNFEAKIHGYSRPVSSCSK